MERIRLGKSKGVHQIQKQKSHAGLSADDSATYFDGNTRGHKLSLEMGKSSARRSTSRPVVKMLTEMYNGMKPKRKSPSFIARLLGLEHWQSQRRADRKQKRSSDSHPQNDVSIEIQGNRPHCDGRSDKRTSMEQRELADLYEDNDPSNFMNRRYSSRWRTANSMLMSSDKKFDNQKFAGARNISTHEKFQVTEALDDTFDLPHSKDILVKSFTKRGSSPARNMNDLQVNTGGSHMNHEEVLKLSNSEKYGCSANAWMSERGSSSKLPSPYVERRDGSLLDPNYRHMAHTSNIQFQDRKGKEMNSSRVEFPKPNLNDMQTSGMPGSYHNHSQGDLPNFRGVSENPSARCICRTTRPVRNVWNECSLLRGYAGDVSSLESQDSDSDSEWDMFGLPSRNFVRTGGIWRQYLSSGSVECNDRVPKKRSEIWSKTEKYQNLEIVSRDSTPGTKVATPDEDARSILLNAETSLVSANSKHRRGNTIQEGPSYISSKDGGKDEIHGTFSRSISVPTVATSSDRKDAYHDLFVGKAVVICGNTACSCGSKVEKENLCCPCHQTNTIDFSAQVEFELKMEPNVKNVSEQQLMCELAEKDDSSLGTCSSRVVSEHESTTTLSFKSFLLDPAQSSGADEDKSDICNPEDISLQEPPNEPLENPVDCEGFDRLNTVFHELRMQLLLLNMNFVMSPDASVHCPLEKHIAKLSSILSEGNYRFDSQGWEVSYLANVLIHSGLQESDFDILKLTWHSPDSPLDPTSFDEVEKIYGDNPPGSMPERKLLFDRINLALFDIFLQHINLFPWVMPGSSGLWKKKESAMDVLERMINQECAIGKAPERVFDRDMQWADDFYRGEIDITGIEIEMMLIDEMIDELV